MLRKAFATVLSSQVKIGRSCAVFIHSDPDPDLTKNKYDVSRGDYNSLEKEHVQFFTQLLGDNRAVTDPSDLERYNTEFFGKFKGYSQIVLKPKTTDEVSKILSFCNTNRLAVVPHGGNTGLVGGAVPVFDEIVLSTELMNEIISLDETSGALRCQAGCILQSINDYLEEKNLIFPLDLASKSSCQIGGNVATNAGGLRLLKYGNIHGNILGLEVVLANGEILDCISDLKKNNTGYHLPHIFVGSEGTLGVITKVSVQCSNLPMSTSVAFLGVESFAKVLETFKKAKRELDEILSAFEMIDTPTMNLIGDSLEVKPPIGEYPFYALIETSGSNQEHDKAKLHTFLESCLDNGNVLNGTAAEEPTKIEALWEVRERIAEAIFKDGGHCFLYDISLPLNNYYRIVDDVKKHLGDKARRVFGFGHIGDSNLHLQVSIDEFSPELAKVIDQYVFERTQQLNGSISAEHGIGFVKAKYMSQIKTPATVTAMKNLKRVMDPNGILNPNKVFVL